MISALRARLRTDSFAPVALSVGFVVAFGVWLLSPRFSATGPFVVDDWFSIEVSRAAMRGVLHLNYDSAALGDAKRYRPAFTAVWSWLQWHTFGAPQNMTGPNVWNIVRLAVFSTGVTLTTFVGLRGLRPEQRPRLAMQLSLAALPATFILVTPAIDASFLRFGPQEQLLLGGLLLGGLVLLDALRRLLLSDGQHSLRSRLTIFAEFFVGYLVWLLGVYSKEPSVCVFTFAPFLYLYLNDRWQHEQVVSRPLIRSRSFLVLAVLMLLPVLHMGYEVLRLAGGATTIYGTQIPHSLGGWVNRLRLSWLVGWTGIPGSISSAFWQTAMIGSALLTVAISIDRRRVQWLPIGLIVFGVVTMVFQGINGTWNGRYFVPTFALTAIAMVLLAAAGRSGMRWIVLGLAAYLLVFTAGDRRLELQRQANEVKAYVAGINYISRLNPGRCPVYLNNLGVELADSVPVLVGYANKQNSAPCDARYAGLMVAGVRSDPAVTNGGIDKVCATGPWVVVKKLPAFTISGCAKFNTGSVYVPPLGMESVQKILTFDRLIPGERLSIRNAEAPTGPLASAGWSSTSSCCSDASRSTPSAVARFQR